MCEINILVCTDIGYKFSFLSFRRFLFSSFSSADLDLKGKSCGFGLVGGDWVYNEDCMGLGGWWQHSGQIRSGWGDVKF